MRVLILLVVYLVDIVQLNDLELSLKKIKYVIAFHSDMYWALLGHVICLVFAVFPYPFIIKVL